MKFIKVYIGVFFITSKKAHRAIQIYSRNTGMNQSKLPKRKLRHLLPKQADEMPGHKKL